MEHFTIPSPKSLKYEYQSYIPFDCLIEEKTIQITFSRMN